VNAVDMLLAEGRRQGRAEGRAEGQREMLVRLLGKRFGALSEDLVARVNGAEPAQLEAWFDRVLTEPTLAGILGVP
jgi:hypothetical protein